MATSDLNVGILAPSSLSSPPPPPPPPAAAAAAKEEAFRVVKEEAMSATASGTHVAQVPDGASAAAATEVEAARCDCCDLTEECTAAYIERVRARHGGRWVCGLCAEAVKEEALRRVITPEEAFLRHKAFCGSFRSAPAPEEADANEHLIAAMSQLLRRSLDSPRARSAPNSPRRRASGQVGSPRSGGFFPAMAG